MYRTHKNYNCSYIKQVQNYNHADASCKHHTNFGRGGQNNSPKASARKQRTTTLNYCNKPRQQKKENPAKVPIEKSRTCQENKKLERSHSVAKIYTYNYMLQNSKVVVLRRLYHLMKSCKSEKKVVGARILGIFDVAHSICYTHRSLGCFQLVWTSEGITAQTN
jgi:hypothetical protein